MDGEARTEIVQALRTMYPVGSSIEEFRISDFREEHDQIVLVGHYAQDPHLYGIPLNWERTSTGFFYDEDRPLNADDWIDSVSIGLMVWLDTSCMFGSRRRKVDDYIELVEQEWPESPFYVQEMNENPIRFDYLGRLGWDVSLGQQVRGQDKLLAWVDCYWNTVPSETTCQVVVSRGADPTVGEVALIDALPGTPVTAVVDSVLLASHLAAWKGASQIMSTVTAIRSVGELRNSCSSWCGLRAL